VSQDLVPDRPVCPIGDVAELPAQPRYFRRRSGTTLSCNDIRARCFASSPCF